MAISNKHHKRDCLPIAALLSGAAIWGVIWYPYRLLEQAGISGEIATTGAYFIALLLGILFFRKSIRFSHIFNGKAHLLFWIGFFAGWANIGYILGIIAGEIVRVLLLFYLAPLWTILFAWLLLDERLSLYGYFVIILSLTGAATILSQPDNELPLLTSYADWMGLLGGFMYALVNVLVRKDQSHNIQLKSLAICLGNTLVGLGCSLMIKSPLVLPDISPDSWLLLIVIGLTMFLLSVILQYGLTHTAANRAIVILLLELFVATITAYFLANEGITLMEWIGGAMIISASLLSAKINRA
ncbi:Permease of the drug/metabolite transporter (DMT) superfamily [Nitrosomonas cryotolerans]|uniref:Permease of the drug/metabolite transporter (DMT) superfamily n=1 Tax=Nitrosomonas cryotolerans ATCC 49181 TaxID=1131553 RepID=A0A1N6IIN7_9PROT|nr:DMT family transporter [Nitrosomonas cryotolerans]SFP89766.1 Permease of the drug/metabolite transporter (DMT) superfamily [Nitrosomonas cryotolerans]SIO31894.1 Permease of the drug/metabolite transporter (DMT) superfamily [Nitrosomonas cryotolerans ATCC 49181]